MIYLFFLWKIKLWFELINTPFLNQIILLKFIVHYLHIKFSIFSLVKNYLIYSFIIFTFENDYSIKMEKIMIIKDHLKILKKYQIYFIDLTLMQINHYNFYLFNLKVHFMKYLINLIIIIISHFQN